MKSQVTISARPQRRDPSVLLLMCPPQLLLGLLAVGLWLLLVFVGNYPKVETALHIAGFAAAITLWSRTLRTFPKVHSILLTALTIAAVGTLLTTDEGRRVLASGLMIYLSIRYAMDKSWKAQSFHTLAAFSVSIGAFVVIASPSHNGAEVLAKLGMVCIAAATLCALMWWVDALKGWVKRTGHEFLGVLILLGGLSLFWLGLVFTILWATGKMA